VLNVHQHKNLYKFYFFSFDNISLFLPYLLTYKQIIHTEFVGYVYAVCTEHFTYQWYINLSLSNGNTEHKFHKPAMLLYILATPPNPPPKKKSIRSTMYFKDPSSIRISGSFTFFWEWEGGANVETVILIKGMLG